MNEIVAKHFWANYDRFPRISANLDQNFAISSQEKHGIELKRCPLGRARRVLPGKLLSQLESEMERILT